MHKLLRDTQCTVLYAVTTVSQIQLRQGMDLVLNLGTGNLLANLYYLITLHITIASRNVTPKLSVEINFINHETTKYL